MSVTTKRGHSEMSRIPPKLKTLLNQLERNIAKKPDPGVNNYVKQAGRQTKLNLEHLIMDQRVSIKPNMFNELKYSRIMDPYLSESIKPLYNEQTMEKYRLDHGVFRHKLPTPMLNRTNARSRQLQTKILHIQQHSNKPYFPTSNERFNLYKYYTSLVQDSPILLVFKTKGLVSRFQGQHYLFEKSVRMLNKDINRELYLPFEIEDHLFSCALKTANKEDVEKKEYDAEKWNAILAKKDPLAQYIVDQTEFEMLERPSYGYDRQEVLLDGMLTSTYGVGITEDGLIRPNDDLFRVLDLHKSEYELIGARLSLKNEDIKHVLTGVGGSRKQLTYEEMISKARQVRENDLSTRIQSSLAQLAHLGLIYPQLGSCDSVYLFKEKCD